MFQKIKAWFDGRKTKIMGWAIFVISVASTVKDATDGGAFSFQAHLTEILAALGGLGIVAGRSAIQKVQDAIEAVLPEDKK